MRPAREESHSIARQSFNIHREPQGCARAGCLVEIGLERQQAGRLEMEPMPCRDLGIRLSELAPACAALETNDSDVGEVVNGHPTVIFRFQLSCRFVGGDAWDVNARSATWTSDKEYAVMGHDPATRGARIADKSLVAVR